MLWGGIDEAAKCIREGGVVAFPTETVYGLGADAFNATAVSRIYSAKGRPGDNPLILHVASAEKFFELAQTPPPYAAKLIEAFWPGALTLVVKKKSTLPQWLGGHPDRMTDTIGIRMPANSIARAIVASADCVIAAPSANKAGTPSPTTAVHVSDDFASGEIDMIVDGGSVELGLESTVVDVTGETPVILRPGGITAEMISRALGMEIPEPSNMYMATYCSPKNEPYSHRDRSTPRAPGMKYRHYAPKAPVTVVFGSVENIAAYIMKQCEQKGAAVGVLTASETQKFASIFNGTNAKILHLGNTPEAAALNLFAHLREFDKLGVMEIFAEAVSDEGIGAAIMDRLLKAAEGRVVHV